jgi:hypothetical protein
MYSHWSHRAVTTIADHSLRRCQVRGAFIAPSPISWSLHIAVAYGEYPHSGIKMFIGPLEIDYKFVHGTVASNSE